MGYTGLATLLAALGGLIGTGLGGWAGFCLPEPKEKTMACILNGTGGLMLAVVCFELLPEAYVFDWPHAVLGFTMGGSGIFGGGYGDGIL